MPSKSPAQKHMMAAAAHDPTFAKKVGVPTKVAKEFNRADSERRADMARAHSAGMGGKAGGPMGGGAKAGGKGPMGGAAGNGGKGMVKGPKGR